MMLQMNVEETKRMLPSDVEKGITWTDAELTGTSLTYTYKLNENNYDLSVAKENEKSIKEAMIPEITADKPMVRALVNTKRTLCYKYVDKSKRSFTIKFEVHELKSLL